MGPNSLFIEQSLDESVPQHGFIDSRIISIGEFMGNNAQLAAVASGTVGFANLEHGTIDIPGIQWDDTAAAADVVRFAFVVPSNYAKNEDKLELAVMARKIEGGSANADLALNCTALYLNPDSTGGETQAGESLVLATASGNDYNYERLIYDISGLGLKPGSVLMLSLAPNEAPGTSNFIEMIGAELRYR